VCVFHQAHKVPPNGVEQPEIKTDLLQKGLTMNNNTLYYSSVGYMEYKQRK